MPALTLRSGPYEATFRPDLSMLCTSLRHRSDEFVAWPRTIAQYTTGGATAVPLMHPWVNRLGRWGYSAAGRKVRIARQSLPVDTNGLPIHGNLFGVTFDVVRASDTRAVARFDYGAHASLSRAFPFPHTVTVDARLASNGLTIVTTVTPTDDSPVPISFGWHPYLRLPDGPRREWVLRWPACDHVEVDARTIPTGDRTPQAAEKGAIGARTYDDHYTLGADRRFSIASNDSRLTLRFDDAYPFAQLYVPPRRRHVAIEPMTAEIDALGRGTAPVCPPGKTFRAAFTLTIGRANFRTVPGALNGIRILDLSWGIAGPLGVLLLAEQGADVIKVEPPDGDPFRAYDGARVWNRSRRSLTVDLKSERGKEIFDRLLGTADVLVESFRPGVMERLGFGYDAVHARHPRVVFLSCPAYPPGHRFANRPGYDALVQASSGQMWEQPGWRLGPVFLHMPMPSMGAFFLVSTGVLAALFAREETGRGQHVTTSLFAGAMLYTTQIWQHVEKANTQFHELMGKSYPPGVHQQFIMECADGWVHTSVMSGLAPTKSQDEILGLDDAPDPFTFMALPPEEREKFNSKRREKFKEWKRDEIVAEFQKHNHGIEAIITPDEQFTHPQLIANDMVKTVVDPVVGETTQVGSPLHMFGTPTAIQGPQPLPGEHNEEILKELGL